MMKALWQAELDICRDVDAKSKLALFMQNRTRWELLLLIALLDGDTEYGISSYIEMLETRRENHMTIYRFIKARIDDGALVLVDGGKKSRKTLVLGAQLREDLAAHMHQRQQAYRGPARPK